jgi:autotransporter translocation and assembly factor TamB
MSFTVTPSVEVNDDGQLEIGFRVEGLGSAQTNKWILARQNSLALSVKVCAKQGVSADYVAAAMARLTSEPESTKA